MDYKNIDEMEPAFKRMLELLIPDSSDKYKGASNEEIKKIEDIAMQKLPDFYYWFLAKISKSEEILKGITIDFSPKRVLAGFRPLFKNCEEDPSNIPQNLFCIGIEKNYNLNDSGYYYYDLNKIIRDDAPVLIHFDCEIEVKYETFREMITNEIFLINKFHPAKNKKSGYFVIRSLDEMKSLDEFMKSLKIKPLSYSGDYFKLFKLNDTFISMQIDVECFIKYQAFFRICGENSSEISELLEKISNHMKVELHFNAPF